MIYKLFLTILIAFFSFSCKTAEIVNSANTSLRNQKFDNFEISSHPIPKDLLITLDRRGCIGSCPIYDLTIRFDGTVSFHGKENTKILGKAKRKISKSKIRILIKEIGTARYFNLNGKYDIQHCMNATDDASAVTGVRINGKTKSIDHYAGCMYGNADFQNELSRLTRLEDRIDEIVGTKQWVGKRN